MTQPVQLVPKDWRHTVRGLHLGDGSVRPAGWAVDPRTVPAGNWKVDPTRSEVSFHLQHLGFQRVRGDFRSFAARIITSGDSSGSVSASVDLASFDSNNALRDRYLKGRVLLDVDRFPTCTYQSEAVQHRVNTLIVGGDVGLFGAAHHLKFVVHIDEITTHTLRLSARAAISRRQFGINLRMRPSFLDRGLSDRIDLVVRLTADAMPE